MTCSYLFQVELYAAARLGQTEKEILQGKIVEDDNARMLARDFKHASVITVIVAHVIDDRVVVTKRLQHARIAAVIKVGKLSAYLRVRRFEAVDEESDLRVRREIRQEFFAVVGNPGRLRIQWAEVGEFHSEAVSRQWSVERDGYVLQKAVVRLKQQIS